MARIPTADELGIVRPTATAHVSVADTSAIGRGVAALGSGIQQASSEMMDVAQTWQRQDDAVDTSNGEARKLQVMTEASIAASQRSDYQNFAKFGEETARKAIEAGAAVIRNPQAREKWVALSQSDAVKHAENMKALGIDRERADNVSVADQALENMRRIYADPQTPEETRKRVLGDIQASIDVNKNAGLYSEEQANERRVKFLEGSQYALAQTYAAEDPQKIGRTYASLDKEHGLPVGFLGRAAMAESDNTGKPTGSQRGIFQFTQNDIDELLGPGHSPDNHQDNLDAMIAETKRNQAALKSVLGRDPTQGELFLAHNQGLAGAKAILSNPDAPILDVLSQFKDGAPSAKVKGNGGSVDQTAGQFASGVIDLFDRKAIAGALPGTKVDLSPYLREGKDRSAVDNLSQGFKSGLAAMFDSMPAELKGQVKIGSAYRTPEEQSQILSGSLLKRVGAAAAQKWQDYIAAAGGDVVKAGEAARPWLQQLGITKWVAPPGASNHQKGQAADLDFGSDAAREWVHANAEKYGLRFRMDHENWHIEPMTVSDVASGASSRFDRAPRSDKFVVTADLSKLSPEQQRHIREMAEKAYSAQETLAKAQTKQVQDEFHDRLGLMIETGDPRVTKQGIMEYRQSGQISDQQATNLLKAYDTKEKHTGIADAIIGASSAGDKMTLNPYSEDARKGADAAYDKMNAVPGANPLANVDRIHQATGLVPPKAVSQLRGAIVGTDPKAAASALQIVNNLTTRNPNVFAGDQGGSDLANKAAVFRHRVVDLHDTQEEAAKYVQASDDPTVRSRVKVDEAGMKDFRDEIINGSWWKRGIAKYFDKSWAPGTPDIGQNDAVRLSMLNDFAEIASEFYGKGYADDDAKAMAARKLQDFWGVSGIQGTGPLWGYASTRPLNGLLMKYPPELRYPMAPDKTGSLSHQYILEQAVDFVKEHTGNSVKKTDIVFLPNASETAAAWDSGAEVPYRVMYSHKDASTGQTILDVIEGKSFRADPKKAIDAFDRKQMEAHRDVLSTYEPWVQAGDPDNGGFRVGPLFPSGATPGQEKMVGEAARRVYGKQKAAEERALTPTDPDNPEQKRMRAVSEIESEQVKRLRKAKN